MKKNEFLGLKILALRQLSQPPQLNRHFYQCSPAVGVMRGFFRARAVQQAFVSSTVTTQLLSRAEMVKGGRLKVKNSQIPNDITPSHEKVNNSANDTPSHPDGKQRQQSGMEQASTVPLVVAIMWVIPHYFLA